MWSCRVYDHLYVGEDLVTGRRLKVQAARTRPFADACLDVT